MLASCPGIGAECEAGKEKICSEDRTGSGLHHGGLQCISQEVWQDCLLLLPCGEAEINVINPGVSEGR